MDTTNADNKLYWSFDFNPDEKVEVRLVLANYVENDNLYAGLYALADNPEDGWEPFTDLTINLCPLPPFHAYVDNRDCNRGVHEFLIRYGIAAPADILPERNGFKLFRFNKKRLEELAPKSHGEAMHYEPPFPKISETLEYDGKNYPIRIIRDGYGLYTVSIPELKNALLAGIKRKDGKAQELYGSICHYYEQKELECLPDEEILERMYCNNKGSDAEPDTTNCNER